MFFLIRWVLAVIGLGAMAAHAALAVEVVDGPQVEVTGTTATIAWKLDTPAGGTVRYGTKAGDLSRSVKSPVVAKEHRVTLDGLEPGTRYQFSIGTARKPLKEGAFQVPGGGGSARGGATNGAAQAPDAPPQPKTPPSAGKDPSVGKAPPTRQTWANVATLRDHYERHGADFASTSPDDYAAQAWRFLQRAKSEGLPAKVDPEGTLRVWDPKSGAFAAYNREGRTKTFFKPGSAGYFDRQPGRVVRLKPGEGSGIP